MEALGEGAAGHGTTLELAVSWLVRQSTVASAIAGEASAGQVTAHAAAPSWELTEADLTLVDEPVVLRILPLD